MFGQTLLAVAAIALQTTTAIPTISAVGSKFFTSEGNQFYIKGIAYQLLPDDPLIDTNQCQTDAALMKSVGANTIRVYHVDPNANHDGCMDAFASNGIYLFLDLDTFSTQIEGPNPKFDDRQFKAFAAVMDAFQQYSNLAGFFIGNEVLTKPSDVQAAVYVKSAVAALKQYRDRRGYRQIPVGYSAADIATLRPMLQNYLVCGDNATTAIDFYGLNAYEWCGPQTYQQSGYENLNKMAAGYPVPIFFSETGCITAPPRTFEEMKSILGPDMQDTWSGAIVYEWIQEENKYGLIEYGKMVDNKYGRSGTPTPIAPDFTNLQNQWATLNPTGVKLADYSPNAKSQVTPACPSQTQDWSIDGNPPILAVGADYAPASTPKAPTGAAGNTGSLPAATTSAGGSSGSGNSNSNTNGGGSSGSAAPANAAATTSAKGGANGGKEMVGMSAGLGAVFLAMVMAL